MESRHAALSRIPVCNCVICSSFALKSVLALGRPEIQTTAIPASRRSRIPAPSGMKKAFDSVLSEWILTQLSVRTPSTSRASSRGWWTGKVAGFGCFMYPVWLADGFRQVRILASCTYRFRFCYPLGETGRIPGLFRGAQRAARTGPSLWKQTA